MIALGFCSGSTLTSEFVQSLVATYARWPDYAERTIHVTSGPDIGHARNLIAKTFLATEWDQLLMVDTDIVFTPDDIHMLARSDYPIISGLYRASDDKLMAARWQDGFRWPLHAPGFDGIYPKVDAVGMGFCLIERKVLADCSFDPVSGYGEDVSFCIRATERGYPIHLDPRVRVGHVKPSVLRP